MLNTIPEESTEANAANSVPNRSPAATSNMADGNRYAQYRMGSMDALIQKEKELQSIVPSVRRTTKNFSKKYILTRWPENFFN